MKKLLLFTGAMMMIHAADRKAAIDQLVQPLVDSGTIPGVVVAVIENGKPQILGYGKGSPDASTIFEIGSVTKTFTTLALAQMVEQKMVALDDPIRKYLPAGAVPPGKDGDTEIRLIDLASQHSGLPRLPSNLHPKDMANPYIDYSPQLLYAYLAERGLHLDPNAGFIYSNLGVGLLGHVLTLRYGKSYEQMIIDLVANPLGLNDTRVNLSADQRKRFIQGYDADGDPVHTWELDALAGAGALRSDAADLARYIQAQMDPPEKMKPAIELAHAETHKIAKIGSIALAWLIKPDGKTYWHDGGTAGFSTYVSFNTERKTGVVVLVNSGGTLMDQIGDKIEHVQAGEAVQPFVVHHAVTLESKDMDEYVGAYEVIANVRAQITRDGDKMFIQLPRQPKYRLYAEAKDKLFLRVVEASVTFDRDPQGKITGLVLHQGERETKAARVQ